MWSSWAIAKKNATAVVYVGTHFFPNSQKALDLIVMHTVP